MWYVICFMAGVAVGGLAMIVKYETKCRECGVGQKCEEFP